MCMYAASVIPFRLARILSAVVEEMLATWFALGLAMPASTVQRKASLAADAAPARAAHGQRRLLVFILTSLHRELWGM